MRALLHVAALLATVALAEAAYPTCYKPNGSAQGPEFVPCLSSRQNASYCCGANRVVMQSPHAPDDTCLGNGLCSSPNPDGKGVNATLYFRGGCSDSSWSTGNCLPLVCMGTSQVDGNGMSEMTPCDGTPTSKTWCCGHLTRACCGKGAAAGEVTIAQALISSSTTSSAASATSTTSSAASGTLASSSPTARAAQSGGDSSSNRTVAIGAGVGVGVGAFIVLLIAGLLLVCFRRRRNKKRIAAATLPSNKSVYPQDSASQYQYHPASQHPGYDYASYVASPAMASPGTADGYAHNVSAKHAPSASMQSSGGYTAPTELASDREISELPATSMSEKAFQR